MEKRISFVGVQTHLTANKEENLKQALCLVDEALSLYKDVDMLVLPEYFYWAPDPKDTPFIEEYPEYIIEEFSSRAKLYNTYILAGTVANKRADGNIYNTAMLLPAENRSAPSHPLPELSCPSALPVEYHFLKYDPGLPVK